MAPAPNSFWSSSILSPQGMMFCSSGSPEVRGVMDAHLTSGSASPTPFHTPAGLTTRPLSSLHAGSSFPPFADAALAPVSSFSALWAIFSDLTQLMSSVTGAFHPRHPNREHLVPICFTWFDEGRRKDIFSFPLQCLSGSQELSTDILLPGPSFLGPRSLLLSIFLTFEASARRAEIGQLDRTDLRLMTANIQEISPTVKWEERKSGLDFHSPVWKHHFLETLFCL